MNQKFIWITTQFEAMHCYPAAPEEVAFLRHSHRHMFHVKVQIQVFHNDRDLEFIMEKRSLNMFLNNSEMGSKSCETIAEDIYNNWLVPRCGKNRRAVVEVSEDNENGCCVLFEAQR